MTVSNQKSLFNLYEDFVSDILPQTGQKFWLIRTDGGNFYEDFRSSGLVGITHSDFRLDELTELRNAYTLKNGQIRLKQLKQEVRRLLQVKNQKRLDKIAINYGNDSSELANAERELSLKAGQISKFAFELKKGDYVVIPSLNSELISIGRVEETLLSDTRYLTDVFLKKKIKWLDDYPRNTLDPNFFRVFWSHQAINDISKYRDVVLRTVYDFYIDQDKGHLVLNVNTYEINGVDYFGFGYTFLTCLQEYFDTNNLPFRAADVNIVCNVNSPGKLKLFSKSAVTITAAALLVLSIVGGSGTFDFGDSVKFDLRIDGIIKSITKYKNQQLKREYVKQLQEQSDSLSIKEPKDVIEIIKTLDSN